jgi:hypothetical protein
MTMVEHPKKLGFELGLKIRIGGRSSATTITEEWPRASVLDVVYVALLPETGRTLEKGDALKIGQTKGSAKSRWKSIASLFKGKKLRNNENNDRMRLLMHAKGKEISVWVKEAEKVEIPYIKKLLNPKKSFSMRCAEEEFLDEYYQPKFGKRLNRHAAAETE